MINRHQLISILINELGLTENEREFLAKMKDDILLQHLPFRKIRQGYYY